MKSKKIFLTAVFVVSLFTAAFAVYKFGTASSSSASVIKNYREADAQSNLTPVMYNGEKMYVANSTFYDYYSDSQVGESATPGKITDALNYSRNTFGKFNTRLLEIMKYGDKENNPADSDIASGGATYTSVAVNAAINGAMDYVREFSGEGV